MRRLILLCLLAVCVVFSGCKKSENSTDSSPQADETISLETIKANIQNMDAEQIRQKALEYKDAILAKKDQVSQLIENHDDVPLTEKLGDEAKGLMSEINALNDSVSALKSRFDIYYDKLKELNADTSGLNI